MKFYRALLAALLFSGFASVLPAHAQNAESLTVYSGRNEALMKPLFDRFIADTGIQLNVRYGSTTELAATILEEGANSPADVYIAQDAGSLGALSAAGRLVKLPSDILAPVPTAFKGAGADWVGLSGRARVLVYNPDLVSVDQLPASILDLTKPEWKGKIGFAPTNASFQAHVTALRVLIGEEATKAWLEGLVANEAKAYEGNNQVLKDGVATGEVAVGLINHYYLLAAQKETQDIKAVNYFFPANDPGTLINVAGAGIVNTTAKAGLAQRFVLYLLGIPAQTYFADSTNEYPVIAGVAGNPNLTPLDQIQAVELDLNTLSDLQGTLDLLRETNVLP